MFADTYCRKCHEKNSAVFFAPVFVPKLDARTGDPHSVGVGTHICLACAEERNWIDHRTGNIAAGVSL